MAWYNTKANDSDVVLSTRIRLARNVKDYPFSPLLDTTGAGEIIEKVKASLSDFEPVDINAKSHIERRSLVEKHIISPLFEKTKSPGALFIDKDEKNAVMVCEEDHLRIQSIYPGYALNEAFKSACAIDDTLDSSLSYAYSEKLGYLTHCPTNLGTGMRASVMMFLPALTGTKMLAGYASQLEKIGLTMRGTYGEGSGAKAYIYQISNSVTMGITEEETISKLEGVVKQLIESERKTRERIFASDPDSMCDRVLRSYGILKWAYMISSDEFLKLWADIKLGVDLGIIKDIDDKKLIRIFVGAMPATLMLDSGKEDLSDTQRDKLRADYLKKQFS